MVNFFWLGIVGLGYVGLLLVVEFGWLLFIVGFDISIECVVVLCVGIDYMCEILFDELCVVS